jgi:orotidine-5'-phosphate decarboxylase
MVCKYGMNKQCGLLVNVSRSILYADTSEHFAEAAAEKAKEYQLQMASFIHSMAY